MSAGRMRLKKDSAGCIKPKGQSEGKLFQNLDLNACKTYEKETKNLLEF